jgi:hypothetical protein
MEKIPIDVLDEICMRLFSFLWFGIKEKEGLHLVKWNMIAKPKKKGGWGIKKIYLFGKALASKSLWSCLMVFSLWHNVVQNKYLKQKYVVEWLREGRKNLKQVSNCWKDLTSSMQIITNRISWNRNNGWEICIGVDPLVGSQSYYKLFSDLVSVVHSKGIVFLAQVVSNVSGGLVDIR